MTFDALSQRFDETMARSRIRAEALAGAADDLAAIRRQAAPADDVKRHRWQVLEALVEDLGR